MKAKPIIQIISLPIILYLSIYFHELGHALQIITQGGEVLEFNVGLFGGNVQWMMTKPMTLEQLRLIYVSGHLLGIGSCILIILALQMMKLHLSTWFAIIMLVNHVLYMGMAYDTSFDTYKFITCGGSQDIIFYGLFLTVICFIISAVYFNYYFCDDIVEFILKKR